MSSDLSAGGRTAAEGGTAARALALTLPLGLAAVAWVVAVREMSGMDMGTATTLGSLPFFAAQWVSMMAAMMLPAATPAVLAYVRGHPRLAAAPLFVGSYLVVWALVGAAVYTLYRPHGTLAAGVTVIAAGLYEFTPLKRHFRQRCRDGAASGFRFGLCCIGSSIGLMAMLVVLGVMSILWMAVIAAVVLVQKFLPVKGVVDAALGVAIVALGLFIVLAPSSVPGLVPSM